MEGLRAAGDKVKGWAESLNAKGHQLAGLSDKLDPLSQKSAAVADALEQMGDGFGGSAAAVSPLARGIAQLSGSGAKLVTNLKNSAEAMAALSLAATAAGYLPALLGALISPAGLAAVAIAGIGYALVNYTDVGQQAFDTVTDKLGEFRDEALDTLGAMANAVAAGDLSAAWAVLSSTVKVLWQEAVIYVEEKWLAIDKLLIDAWAELQNVWIDITLAMQQAWSDFYNHFIKDSSVMKQVLAGVAGAFFGGLGEDVVKLLETAGESGPAFTEAAKRRQEIEEERQTAQEDLDESFNSELAARHEALERARAEREEALNRARSLTPKSPAAAAAEQAAAGGIEKSRAVGAIGGEDIRSAKGFAAIAQLTRGGDPQKELAQTQKEAFRLQQRQWIEQRRARERLEAITVVS